MRLVLVLLFISYEKSCSELNGPRAVSTLDFVVVVSKHGARAATHTYPADPYRDKGVWPEGAGQLTRVGKYQMYSLGRRLRGLYNSFLSPLYHGSQILPQSTLVDRTMCSAATLLAGLYPPLPRQRWHPNITWQPIPIYPNLLDKALLVLEPESCPRYLHEQNVSVQAIPSVQQSFGDLSELFGAMSAGTGRNVTSLSQLFILYQNLAALDENNLPLPEWAQPIFTSRIVPIVSRMVRHTTIQNLKMIKIIIGPFLDSLLMLLKQRPEMTTAEEATERLRMMLHVGHDITVMALLTVLGYGAEEIPWAATSLVFEVHHNPGLGSQHQLQASRQ